MGNCKRVAFYVNKGGVAKTTSAAHVAVAASQEHDLDVVVLDLSATQNDLATAFGLADEVADPDAPVSAIFGDDWTFIASNIENIVDRMVYETDEGPDIIPSDSGLPGADNNLASVPVEQRYLKLDQFISGHLAERYDLVVLDLPGKEDNISLNGVIGAGDIVAPLSPGAFELQQLDGLQEDLAEVSQDLESVLRSNGIELRLSMVLPTMIDRRSKQAAEFVDEIEAAFPDRVGPPIARSQNIGNLQAEGRTLFAVDEHDLYATGKRARAAYSDFTSDLLTRLNPR